MRPVMQAPEETGAFVCVVNYAPYKPTDAKIAEEALKKGKDAAAEVAGMFPDDAKGFTQICGNAVRDVIEAKFCEERDTYNDRFVTRDLRSSLLMAVQNTPDGWFLKTIEFRPIALGADLS